MGVLIDFNITFECLHINQATISAEVTAAIEKKSGGRCVLEVAFHAHD